MKKEAKAMKTTDILGKIKKFLAHTYRPDKIFLSNRDARDTIIDELKKPIEEGVEVSWEKHPTPIS